MHWYGTAPKQEVADKVAAQNEDCTAEIDLQAEKVASRPAQCLVLGQDP